MIKYKYTHNMEVNMNKIITIGREFGSGGRELGRRLAEYLGYAYYDKEIVSEIAKNTSLSEQYVKQVTENNQIGLYPITIAQTFSYFDVYAARQTQAIFSEQEKVLKQMAEKTNCVIVGRCADYILRDYNPFKIFVYSDKQSKIKRCLNKRIKDGEDITEKKIKKYLKNIDKGRSRFYSFYTGQAWGDKLNYDMCINTSNVIIKDIVPHLGEMLKK